MKKIFLFCEAGMSTSLMVSKMQKVADEKQVPVTIDAYPMVKAHELITEQHPDCILLGPQVRHFYEDMKERYAHTKIPIALLNTQDYALMNGEKALKQAIKMIKENNQ
ncbi:MAG: PTS sugar transporter subunit IIB [Brevinema sp.]